MPLGSRLNFLFNGIVVASPGRHIPPFATKISKPAEHKVVGASSKSFASGSLRITASGATPMSIPDRGAVTPGRQRNSTTYGTLTEHSPERVCLLTGTVTESSKGHSIAQCLRADL